MVVFSARVCMVICRFICILLCTGRVICFVRDAEAFYVWAPRNPSGIGSGGLTNYTERLAVMRSTVTHGITQFEYVFKL